MKPSQRVIDYIKEIETLVSPARHLPADRQGVITGGYGETNPTFVHDGMVVTEEQATAWLEARLDSIAEFVNHIVTVPVLQGQFDALVDFVYNLGASALGGSTLLKKLNAGLYDEASDQFELWDRANGKELSGLHSRRLLEKSWFVGQAT